MSRASVTQRSTSCSFFAFMPKVERTGVGSSGRGSRAVSLQMMGSSAMSRGSCSEEQVSRKLLSDAGRPAYLEHVTESRANQAPSSSTAAASSRRHRSLSAAVCDLERAHSRQSGGSERQGECGSEERQTRSSRELKHHLVTAQSRSSIQSCCKKSASARRRAAGSMHRAHDRRSSSSSQLSSIACGRLVSLSA